MNSNNNFVNCGNISVHVHLAKALHILTRSSPTLAGVNCSVLYSIKALQYNNTTASAIQLRHLHGYLLAMKAPNNYM